MKPTTHAAILIPTVMQQVLLALIPGVIIYAWLISPLIIINIAFCCGIAVCAEAVCLRCQQRSASDALRDSSILVAAVLLAIAVPPSILFWQLGLGVVAMVVLGKHLYGGLGQNIFNPAMVGYVFLLLSFPQSMTLWLDATQHDFSMFDLLQVKCAMSLPAQWDSITQATPLESIRAASLYATEQSGELTQAVLDEIATQRTWPLINIGFFLGGLWLLYKRVISWHIPITVITTLFILHWVLSITATSAQITPTMAVLSGATMLGAFFVATDPVTAATSNTGRVIYAAGIGFLTFIIREWGGYPEGFAFAVLLMNMCAPLIDLILSRHATS
jgi:electron transport complex protein RnfD